MELHCHVLCSYFNFTFSFLYKYFVAFPEGLYRAVFGIVHEAMMSLQSTVRHWFAQLFTLPQYIILQQGFFICSVRFQQAFVLSRTDGRTDNKTVESIILSKTLFL